VSVSYYFLAGAIVFEVCGTLLLPVTQNFTRVLPTIGLAVCYLTAFYCLSFAIREIPIAIVYAIWSGIGVLLIALFSAFVYKQLLDWQAIVGLAMIVGGVALVNLYSHPPSIH
jgi:small multidrug resistance pump